MGPEVVTVAAGGRVWTAFRRVMVRAAINEAARSFQLEIAAEPSASATAWVFKAGTQIDILFNGDLVFRGFVDRYKPSIREHSHAEISVSGRSKGQDAIDSSAIHKTGRFKNKTPLEILQELDKFKIGYTTDQKLEKVPHYQITPGETVFRVGEKLLRAQGLQQSGQPDGSIKITKASDRRHAGALIEGKNIKSAEADHNWSNRHSEVVVRGQRPYGHGPDALEIEATARDNAVDRYRPVVVIQSSDTDKKRAKKRAKNRRDREAGNSLKASVTVQGFRDDSGKLWTPGDLVFLQSDFLAVAQDMLIENATFSQDRSGGSETVLALVDPRAYDGKGKKGGKSNKAWETSGDD